MNKKIIFLMAAAMVVSISQAHAQQAKVYRIGGLFPGGPLSETIDGLRGGFRELGLTEGKNLLSRSWIRRAMQRPRRRPRRSLNERNLT